MWSQPVSRTWGGKSSLMRGAGDGGGNRGCGRLLTFLHVGKKTTDSKMYRKPPRPLAGGTDRSTSPTLTQSRCFVVQLPPTLPFCSWHDSLLSLLMCFSLGMGVMLVSTPLSLFTSSQPTLLVVVLCLGIFNCAGFPFPLALSLTP